MTLNEIVSIADVIGALGIFVTLIYLAIQVKDSARASRSAALTDATSAIQSFYHELGSNRQASELYFRGMRDPGALSAEDAFQFMMLCHDATLAFQRNYFLAKEGTLAHGVRDSIGTAITAVKDLPGFDFYWTRRRAFFQQEFIDWVEQMRMRDPLPGHDIYIRD